MRVYLTLTFVEHSCRFCRVVIVHEVGHIMLVIDDIVSNGRTMNAEEIQTSVILA